MKTSIFAAVIVLLTVTMLTNCQMTNKKLDAQKKMQEAIEAKAKVIQTLNLAMNDSIRLIKTNFAEKTSAYQKNLADYQAQITYIRQANKITTEKKVAALKEKNNAMISRLINYQDTTRINENFEIFRYELGRELSEQDKALMSFNSNI